ncbi:DUF1259 domain-containing protein [Marininema halotolerans]|uniref:Uncharacterized protein n=1 Tax=Marininema halotolerans TaxID=1155944 RepID=A0A1I6U986_9BACL|nr:DUF1259 domain-containing protein [Marininema halotolerans]SFS97972.1 protein of unknown function [Marininema halotolerans]
MKISKRLSEKLAIILGGEILDFSQIPTVVNITNLRTFKATLLGRPTTDPLNNIFSFGATNLRGQTLNIGWFALRQTEITSVVNRLNRDNITVTSICEYSSFLLPKITYVYFQSLSNPISFAVKMRRILNQLPDVGINQDNATSQPSRACTQFSSIVGTKFTEVIGTSCEAVDSRNVGVKILNQRAPSIDVGLINFSIESVDKKNIGLCIGTVALLRHEVDPFIKLIREETGFIDASLTSPWFGSPDILYFNYVTIKNIFRFAIESKLALKFLKNRSVDLSLVKN